MGRLRSPAAFGWGRSHTLLPCGKPFTHDPGKVGLGAFKHGTAGNVAEQVLDLGVCRATELKEESGSVVNGGEMEMGKESPKNLGRLSRLAWAHSTRDFERP